MNTEQSLEQVTRRVCELAAEQVGMTPAEVLLASHFVQDLNYDSLDKVEFAMQVEDEYDLSMPDEDMEGVHTVGQAVDLVMRLLESKGTAKAVP